MTHYEHLIYASTGPYVTFEELDERGRRGWELVTIISRPGLPERAVFKRPIAAPAAAKVAAKKGAK